MSSRSIAIEESSNMKVILKNYISGSLQETDMLLTAGTIKLKAAEGSNEIVVKNLFLSCDPHMLFKMTRIERNYPDSYTPGLPLTGYGIAKVLDSAHPDFNIDDLVWGITGWEEYSRISDTKRLFKIQHKDVPLSYHIGILGMPGLTAYVGFYELLSPKQGDQVFVSAACGAVGQLIGQFARLQGCYVVGSAGSDEKVDLIKKKFGFNEAFNYRKEHNFPLTLKRLFHEGIDIYFDNVGGKMLDAALLNMKIGGRVLACGMISQYNLDQPEGVHNLTSIITKQIQMQGFVVSNYFHLYPKYVKMILPMIKEGKVVYVEDTADGLENAAEALVGLFSGRNVGKQIIAVNSL